MGHLTPFNGFLAIGTTCGREAPLEVVYAALAPVVAATITLSPLTAAMVLIGCSNQSDLVSIVKHRFFLVNGGFFEVSDCTLTAFDGTNLELEKYLFWKSFCLNQRIQAQFLRSERVFNLPKPPAIKFLPRTLPTLKLDDDTWPKLGVSVETTRHRNQIKGKAPRKRSAWHPLNNRNCTYVSKVNASLGCGGFLKKSLLKKDENALNKSESSCVLECSIVDSNLGLLTDLALHNPFSILVDHADEVFGELPTSNENLFQAQFVQNTRVWLRGSEHRMRQRQFKLNACPPREITLAYAPLSHNVQPRKCGEASRLQLLKLGKATCPYLEYPWYLQCLLNKGISLKGIVSRLPTCTYMAITLSLRNQWSSTVPILRYGIYTVAT